MVFLRQFENHSEYEAFTATTEFIKPNVSTCVSEDDAHYNPWTDPRVIAKFNVTSTSNPTPIGYSRHISGFSEIEIDGVVQPSVVSAYTFDTTGEHTVKYTLTDPTSIVNNAFAYCYGLASVTIPDSVTSIDTYAFHYCSGLTSVTIGSGVASIGNTAFDFCTSLSSITVGSNNTVYDSRDNCNAIIKTSTNELVVGCKNTVIPNTITSIGNKAFYFCSGLTSVTIPSSVTSIGDNAFDRCSGLTSINIPDSVTSIGYLAFYKCSSLSSITVDSNNTIYDSRDNCNAIIKTSTNELVVGCKNTVIPNTVTSIGRFAFDNCSGLTSVTIPSGVTSIGNYAFRGCSGLTSVTIPNSVTSIGYLAFDECSNLTSVTFNCEEIYAWFSGLTSIREVVIGDNVTTIRDNAFSSCSSLTSITIDAETPPTLGNSAFDKTNNCPIYVPSCESALNYMSNWTAYANRISVVGSVCGKMITYASSSKLIETTSDSDAGLHTYAFSGTSGQLTITSHTFSNGAGTICFDDNVTSIGNSAFSGCTSLTSVIMPNSVTSIGSSAFTRCSGLTSINIPDGVTTINASTFNGCSGLTSINIHDGVTSIGTSAFRGCSSLTGVTIGSGVTSIGDNAFDRCSGLTSITIPNSVTSIGESAFNRCIGLTSVTIGSGVISISGSAFNNCTGLTSVTIGSGVTSIGSNVFYNCKSLTSITSNATTAPTIVSYTFRNVKTNGTLYVPIGSSGYNTWMSTSNYYLGKYGWTKVEQ